MEILTSNEFTSMHILPWSQNSKNFNSNRIINIANAYSVNLSVPNSQVVNRSSENSNLNRDEEPIVTSIEVTVPTSKKIFALYCQNMSGINTKLNAIMHKLMHVPYDVIAIQETFLTNKITDGAIIGNSSYSIVRADRSNFDSSKSIGGGVLCLINNLIAYTQITYLHDKLEAPLKPFLEHVAMVATIDKKRIGIINAYITPTHKQAPIEELSSLISHMKNITDELIICGDFNMPKLDWAYEEDEPGFLTNVCANISKVEQDFCDVLSNNALFQISEVRNDNHRSLDLVIVSNIESKIVRKAYDFEKIDKSTQHHQPIIMTASVDGLPIENEVQLNYQRSNLNHIKEIYTRHIFENITDDDIEAQLGFTAEIATHKINKITNFLQFTLSSNTKKKNDTTTAAHRNHPWLRDKKTYHDLDKNRKKLFKIDVANRTDESRHNYQVARELAENEYDRLREIYYNKIVEVNTGTSYELYQIYRTRHKPRNALPSTMTYKGETINEEHIPQAFLEHLRGSFDEKALAFPSNYDDSDSWLWDIYHQNYSELQEGIWNDYVHECTLEEIEEAIDGLNVKKDPGPMGISAAMIIHCKNELKKVILNVFNAIMKTGHVPYEWKTSYLVPIPKKGNVSVIENYRGISIQSTLPKLLDKILTKRLQKALDNSISPAQHGFRRQKSTASNLLEATQFYHEFTKGRKQIDVIYIDFSKAFDTISHHRMAAKLARMSMPYNFFKVIMNFVINRTYLLKIGNQITNNVIRPTSGVPQGSCLGPTLYIVYTNDLSTRIRNSKPLFYADDTKLIRTSESDEDRASLQSDLNEVVEWAKSNALKINAAKTNVISFSKFERKIFDYYIDTEKIERVTTIKDLGVVFDECLTFEQHILAITNKVKQIIGIGNRLAKEVKSPMIAMKVYSTYAQPIVEYAAVCWYTDTAIRTNALFALHRKVTKSALRIPFDRNSETYATYETRCNILQQICPKNRMQIMLAVTAVKILKGEIRTELADRVLAMRNENRDRFRVAHMFNINRSSLPHKSPLLLCLTYANQFAQHIDMSKTTDTIKKTLRKIFLPDL